MASIWNFLSPLRTGHSYLAKSGNELFGTVIKHGVNNKTITVRVSSQHWQKKYKFYAKTSSNLQVHDEENFCITGDKVVVKLCRPVSNSKSYFVKRIVKPFPRDDFYKEPQDQVEQLEQSSIINKPTDN